MVGRDLRLGVRIQLLQTLPWRRAQGRLANERSRARMAPDDVVVSTITRLKVLRGFGTTGLGATIPNFWWDKSVTSARNCPKLNESQEEWTRGHPTLDQQLRGLGASPQNSRKLGFSDSGSTPPA